MNGLNITKFRIHIIIDKLQSLIDVIILLLLNIFRMYGQNLFKFCIHINIDKIYVGIVNRHFTQICNRVTALD